MQTVATIAFASVTMAGAIWGANYSLRSDVRDIITRLDYQAKIDSEKARLQDERMTAFREALNDMKRRVELQQYEVQRLNETIQSLKGTKHE